MRDNRIELKNISSQVPQKKEVFIKKRKEFVTRKNAREHLAQFHLAYKEYYYYVVEAKIVLHEQVVVSIMTEFVENEGNEVEKQDCERNACIRLMERLKKEFPMLPICLCGNSL